MEHNVNTRRDADRLFLSRKFQTINYDGVYERIALLNERINANYAAVYLLTDTEQCIVDCGNGSPSAGLKPSERGELLSGRPVIYSGGMVQPLLFSQFVIGYLQVECDLQGMQEVVKDLIELYSELIITEMELEFNRSKVEYYSYNLIHEKKERKIAAKQNNIVMEMAIHDVNSPLSAINGYLDLIDNCLKKNEDVEEIKKYYEKISLGVQDMSTIITKFSDFKETRSSNGAMYPVKTNLNWIVREIAELYSDYAGRRHLDLEFKVPETPVFVYADVSKIKRSVINLVINAIKYSKNKGYVQILLQTDGAHAILKVVDEGIGIGEKTKNEIFKPFFQESEQTYKEDPSSVGLGLYIANHFVKEMKGHLDVKSKKGKGSCFTIYLPLAQSDDMPRLPAFHAHIAKAR